MFAYIYKRAIRHSNLSRRGGTKWLLAAVGEREDEWTGAGCGERREKKKAGPTREEKEKKLDRQNGPYWILQLQTWWTNKIICLTNNKLICWTTTK
jgi:hypothetical protein